MIDSITRSWQRGTSTMTCRELNDSLARYTSGELAPGTRRELEQHLLGCAPCVAYLRSYKRTVGEIRPADDLLDQLAPPHAPRDMVESILDATVRATGPSRPRR